MEQKNEGLIDASIAWREESEREYGLHLRMDTENLIKLLDLAVEVGIMEKIPRQS